MNDTALSGHSAMDQYLAPAEVSTGTAPSALTGQRVQPADTVDQPNWGMIQP